jgi:hypothetical protein
VRLDITANPGTTGRVATVTVAGQAVAISQAGVSCSYTIDPTAVTVSALGGVVSISVDATQGCAWTATSGNDWMTVQSGQSGSGKGVVQLGIALYLGLVQRTGSVTIAGLSLSVTQAGLVPVLQVAASSRVDGLAMSR